MKKIVTLALCFASLASVSAQKQIVDQANKLAGKSGQLSEARNLIKQAMQNPETQNDARTYFVAGKIEFDAFDNAKIKKTINPDDPEAKGTVMGDELIAGYEYFMQALPLDSMPNKKGQIKPKYSKDIAGKITSHLEDYFNAGADYFNDKMYYPQAYQAFMIYGDIPGTGLMGKASALVDPAQIATAYFNAGLAAYSGNAVDESANAFAKSRLAGYDQPEAYIYEIACWQNIAQTDESRAKEAQDAIYVAAQAGHEKFGLNQPLFLNNLINSMVTAGDIDGSLAMLADIIAQNPNNANLYGLRGYVYDRNDNDEASESDYRKAASLPDVDYETLKNASKKIFKIGTVKLNEIEGSSPEANAARQDIKVNYFQSALAMAQQANAMEHQYDSDLDNLLDSLDYALTTYFNN